MFSLTFRAHSSQKYTLKVFSTTHTAASPEKSSCYTQAARLYPATDIPQQQALQADCTRPTAQVSMLSGHEGAEPEQPEFRQLPTILQSSDQ